MSGCSSWSRWRDFGTQEAYRGFLEKLFEQLNSGRKQKLAEELDVLRPLPDRRYEGAKRVRVGVNTGSLIAVERNNYSVHSRLIGEIVEARVYSGHVEVWYGGQKLEQMPRLPGRSHPRRSQPDRNVYHSRRNCKLRGPFMVEWSTLSRSAI